MVFPRRHSNSRTGMRRSGRKLPVFSLVVCSNCRTLKPPHVVCPSCGYYKGDLIIQPKAKTKETAAKK